MYDDVTYVYDDVTYVYNDDRVAEVCGCVCVRARAFMYVSVRSGGGRESGRAC